MQRHPPAIAKAILICKSRAFFFYSSWQNTEQQRRKNTLTRTYTRNLLLALLLCSLSAPAIATDENLYEQSFHKAWKLVEDNTAYTERLERWKEWEHKFDGKLKNKQDLELALTKALNNFGDKYTYFRNEDQTSSSRKADQDPEAVSFDMPGPQLAHISIHNFSSVHTADELETALLKCKNCTGYILDLRNNHGGYVEQALACFELLVEHGKFVQMKGREDGAPYEEIISLESDCIKREVNGSMFSESRRKNETANKPMIVLIDENTRSAAEMLAGALRDVDRAVLVGRRTFGKGVVQCSWTIEPACSIKVTMAKYFLPSGEDINGAGINPDTTPDLYKQFFQKTGIEKQKQNNNESLTQLFRTLTQTSAPHRISASTEKSR